MTFPETAQTIRANAARLRERIAAAAGRAGRDPSKVVLLAVTKGLPAQAVAAARAGGLALVGENYVQEALAKAAEAGPLPGLSWRLIGRLQRNKARKALGLFAEIETVDCEALARDLDRIAAEMGREVPVWLEVRAAEEASRSGAAPEGLPALLDACRALTRLKVKGLMTVGPLTGDPALVRAAFARLRDLRDRLLPGGLLSMGMSADFEPAVEEGSDEVRIGSALFEGAYKRL